MMLSNVSWATAYPQAVKSMTADSINALWPGHPCGEHDQSGGSHLTSVRSRHLLFIPWLKPLSVDEAQDGQLWGLGMVYGVPVKYI